MKTKFWIICLSVFFVSCLRNMHDIYTGEEEEEEEKINKDDFFDFTTVRNSQLIIDYGMKVQTAFYLYDEYPMELVGNTWEFKDINPIYAASTDMNGRFFSKVSLPAYLKKVWLVTDNVLVVSPVELEFLSDGLTFNYVDYKAQLSANGHSRAVMGGVSYPDGYDVLGNWNENGVPDYLLPEKLDIPGAFLERCSNLSRSIVVDNRNLLERFPELRTSGSNDMVITKSTGLVATYFDFSSTAWEDMVAYYTYKEGESVDIATIKKTILIPRSSRNAPKSLVGEQIKLKYWNKEQSKYEDEFPQGTHIGWILLGMGFGKEKGVFPRYSNPAYNDNKEQRSVLLSDPELDNCFFMAMEDNVDMRFNDVQFAIMASASSSVEPTPNIPDEVNKGEISYVVKGSLAYEDNWPDKNDYDMNDVVIYYSSTVVKDKSSNALVRTTTTFTPMNDGATYTNGFGFQLDYVGKEHIDLVQVSQEGNVIGKNFEPGIEKPVLILFSDIKPVLKKPVTVVIGFKKYDKVRYERINVRGVGAAFRRGVEVSHGDVVGYMDIDLSTNIRHLGEAIHLFETQPEIQYINGSRFARESDTRGRKWYRRITSQGLLILLKLFLRMKSTDAICGFTFVRRETALSLIEGCSRDNGWFYMIEFLLRAEKRGVTILDYPVEWQEDYNTTVKVFKTICNYLVQIARLFNEFYIKKHI